jgi:hypothetical protein
MPEATKRLYNEAMSLYLPATLRELISVLFRISDKREKRIDYFINSYCNRYKGAGIKLEILIPSGICNLENDYEIKTALEKVEKLGHGHPLRQLKGRIEKVGYKKFFLHVLKSERELNSISVEELLCEIESAKS